MITTVIASAVVVIGCQAVGGDSPSSTAAFVAQGKQIFRFDSFGDETLWTDKLRMHEVVRTAVDPTLPYRSA
jgi:ureidoglycolate hydrolase